MLHTKRHKKKVMNSIHQKAMSVTWCDWNNLGCMRQIAEKLCTRYSNWKRLNDHHTAAPDKNQNHVRDQLGLLYCQATALPGPFLKVLYIPPKDDSTWPFLSAAQFSVRCGTHCLRYLPLHCPPFLWKPPSDCRSSVIVGPHFTSQNKGS